MRPREEANVTASEWHDHLARYRSSLWHLAGCQVLLGVGVLLTTLLAHPAGGWRLQVLNPHYFLYGAVFVALFWIARVRTAFEGGWPESGTEWLWAVGVLVAASALLHAWLIPGLYFYLQLAGALFVILLLRLIGALRRGAPVRTAAAGLLYVGFVATKWSLLEEIERVGVTGLTGAAEESGASGVLLRGYQWLAGYLPGRLTDRDFGLEPIAFDASRTRLAELAGVLAILAALVLGDWCVRKVRAHRRNAYLALIRERVGLDLRAVLETHQLDQFLGAPAEEFDSLLARSLRELARKAREQRAALQALQASDLDRLAAVCGPAAHGLVELRDARAPER